MDPRNEDEFVSKEKSAYWKQVDLYIGGAEHATGHLLYSRFWTKFLFDQGYISFEEPFQKLINQGMILGKSNFVYRVTESNTFVSKPKIKDYDTTAIHVDIQSLSLMFKHLMSLFKITERIRFGFTKCFWDL